MPTRASCATRSKPSIARAARHHLDTGGHLVSAASQVGPAEEKNLREEAGIDPGAVAVDLVAPHFPRSDDWAAATGTRVAALKGVMEKMGRPLPIYLNEERRTDDRTALDPRRLPRRVRESARGRSRCMAVPHRRGIRPQAETVSRRAQAQRTRRARVVGAAPLGRPPRGPASLLRRERIDPARPFSVLQLQLRDVSDPFLDRRPVGRCVVVGVYDDVPARPVAGERSRSPRRGTRASSCRDRSAAADAARCSRGWSSASGQSSGACIRSAGARSRRRCVGCRMAPRRSRTASAAD